MVKVSALEERSSQCTSRLESTSWTRASRVTESCRLAGCSDSIHDKLTGLGETVGIATTSSETGRSTTSITLALASPVTTRIVVEYWPGGFAFDTRVNTMVTGLAVPWAVTCSQPGSVCPRGVPMAMRATAGLLQVICTVLVSLAGSVANAANATELLLRCRSMVELPPPPPPRRSAQVCKDRQDDPSRSCGSSLFRTLRPDLRESCGQSMCWVNSQNWTPMCVRQMSGSTIETPEGYVRDLHSAPRCNKGDAHADKTFFARSGCGSRSCRGT